MRPRFRAARVLRFLAQLVLLGPLVLGSGCAGGLRGAAVEQLPGLPLLPGRAVPLDGSYRVQVGALPAREYAADERPQRVLILVIRSDDDGFRFEGIDELGLPVLAWPTRAELPVLPIDAGTVARLIQFALAPTDLWAEALAGSEWRLAVHATGRHRLLRAGNTHVVADLPETQASGAKLRRLRYCPAGFGRAGTSGDYCAAGDGLAIEVSELADGELR